MKMNEAGMPVAVCAEPADDAALRDAAYRLAEELHMPLVEADVDDVAMLLAVTSWRLELRVVAGEDDLRGGRPLAIDLLAMDTQSHAGARVNQPIARAVGLPGRKRKKLGAPTVFDATAGLGEDAWLLASLGCRVVAVERCAIVAALLRDGLKRAAVARSVVADRIELRIGDSRELMVDADADVIYLDPMFPVGRRAKERKAMRVLRQLAGADEDALQLLQAARQAAPRVVVKRPLRAEALGGMAPTTVHRGRGLRYDVYVRS